MYSGRVIEATLNYTINRNHSKYFNPVVNRDTEQSIRHTLYRRGEYEEKIRKYISRSKR